MSDTRLLALIDRLERAADRLASRPAPDAAIVARNTALRAAMAEAVEGIDRLIAAEADTA